MIRFAVIGTNWITDSFLQAALQVEGFKLQAIYSRTAERAKEFADKYGAPLTFTNLEELAKSTEIDAVYIASPNSLHAAQATMLMKHGKHVLCEKPLAANAAEVSEMIAAAKDNRVLLMEALKSTLVPNFSSIQEQLPTIGTVRRYVASYCQYSSRYDSYREGVVLNAFKPELANGSLMDIGIYCIYPLVVLFGKPLHIQATGLLLESGVDGEGSILLKYDNMEAVVMYSKISNSSLPFEIQGEDGNIVVDKLNVPEHVEVRYRNGVTKDVTKPQHRDSMRYEVEEFIRLIEEGRLESTINSHQNSLLTMEIIDEVRRQIGVVYPSDLRK